MTVADGSLNMEHFSRLMLESVGVGLAVIDAESRAILACNKRFQSWFPEVPEAESLDALLPSLDPEKMTSRIEGGRPYVLDIEAREGKRKVGLAVHIDRGEGKDENTLIVECQNVSKIKELEYMIESYSSMIERQNRDLRREKERAEKLLLNIMPQSVYEEWKELGVTTPKRYDNCSILTLDFVGFTEMAISEDPAALIAELNDMFTSFDRIVEQFGCERIKTLGDAYIAVSGIPDPTDEHAHNIAKVALNIIVYLERRNEAHNQKWECRIGINSGPVIGSIIGVQKYVYDVFGPGINLAARMEQLSGPMEITLCDDMYREIRDSFAFEERGTQTVKGFGEKNIYRLRRRGSPHTI